METTPLDSPPRRPRPWARPVLAGGGLIVALVAAIYWKDVRALLESGIFELRAAGPGIFFAGMALLPAVGFPLLPFTLAAGPVFAPTLGAGTVIACAIGAVTVNVALSYWLATRALRPRVERLIVWLGYRLPEAPAGTAWQVVTIVRVAPGLPFFMQSLLLGLLRTPFVPYMAMSVLIPAGYLTGIILFGEALWQGRTGKVLLAAGVLGLTGAVVHLLRKRQNLNRAKAVAPRRE